MPITKPGQKKPETKLETEESLELSELEPEPSIKQSPIESVKILFPNELAEMLNFEHKGLYVLIRPLQVLGAEKFTRVASIVRAADGDYISMGPQSHFRVPVLPTTPQELPQMQQPISQETSGTTTVLERPQTTEEFMELEKRDEEQIKAELMGAFLKELTYSFKSGDKTIVGLSWAGVKEVARRMGHIKVSDLKVTDTGEAWIAQCKATDLINKFELYGVSLQSKKTVSKGTEIQDPFSLQKAVSKSQRNALRAIIPEGIAKTMMTKLQEESEQRAKMRRVF